MSDARVQVPTAKGAAEVLWHRAADAAATLVLTHGAGGDVDSHDLHALATQLPYLGFDVCLLRMPWRVLGKPLPPAPAAIDECFGDVLTAVREQVRGALVIGGRSAGARSACRLAAGSAYDVHAVLCLAFPLHPPGKPEKSRLDELEGSRVPTLVLQGECDPFGRPQGFPDELVAEVVPVPFADHGLKVPKRADISQVEATELVVATVLEWLVREVVGNDAR